MSELLDHYRAGYAASLRLYGADGKLAHILSGTEPADNAWPSKTAASALRKRVSLEASQSGSFPLFNLLLGDKVVGRAALKNTGKAQIQGMELDPAFRGLGLGKKFYGEIKRRMPNQTLGSDWSVSPDAARAWRSTDNRPGQVVNENPDYLNLTGPRRPQFVGSLPAKAALPSPFELEELPRPVPNSPEERKLLEPKILSDQAYLRRYRAKSADLRTELKPHQQRVVDRITAEDQPGLVVAHGLGSGKTLTSIAAQEALGLPSNVVLPAALRENYQKEIAKHVEGATPERVLSSLQAASIQGAPATQPLLIVDEAHRARDPGSKTYRSLRDAEAQKRLLLTASPFYNAPADIAPLVNIAAGTGVLPADPAEFERRYIATKSVAPGLLDRMRGVQPGEVPILNPKKSKELSQVFSKWVDYHPGSSAEFPTVTREDVKVPMTREQLRVYDTMVDRAPSWVAHKVLHNLPPSKRESKELNAFLGAIRQISNTTAGFQSEGDPQDPKIQMAFDNLKKQLDANERAKAVVYSNYLQSGLMPYKARLEAAGIPYGEFTGEMPKDQRDALVRQYNEGKIRALLLSSAGGEGLDLKGTRLLQILEPHWNEEKLRQVEGRGIRYRSHADLPPEEQNVLVQRYLATRPPSGVFERLGLSKPGSAVDEYLAQRAAEKEQLMGQFRQLLPLGSEE